MQRMTQQAREGYSNTLKSFFEPAGEKIKPDMTFQAQVGVMNNVLKTHSAASSRVTVSHNPSQATMTKSSVPFISTVVTSGSEHTYGL